MFRFERCRTGSPVSSIEVQRSSISSRNTRASSRARCTPRQKCSPMPNDRCGLGLRWMSKRVRIVEDRLVPVGRGVDHRHLVAARRSAARRARCRRSRSGGSSAAGSPSAGPLRRRPGINDRSARSSASWSGWFSRARMRRGQHRPARVVAGHDQLHEEAAEGQVGHRRAVDLCAEQQGDQVLPGFVASFRGQLHREHRHGDRALERIVGPADDVLRPGVDLRAVLDGDADQLADDLGRHVGAQTSWTASIWPVPASSMIRPHTSRMLGSSPAITRARKWPDSESRCCACRGGSMANNMSCIIASESGSRSSRTTPPADGGEQVGLARHLDHVGVAQHRPVGGAVGHLLAVDRVGAGGARRTPRGVERGDTALGRRCRSSLGDRSAGGPSPARTPSPTSARSVVR